MYFLSSQLKSHLFSVPLFWQPDKLPEQTNQKIPSAWSKHSRKTTPCDHIKKILHLISYSYMWNEGKKHVFIVNLLNVNKKNYRSLNHVLFVWPHSFWLYEVNTHGEGYYFIWLRSQIQWSNVRVKRIRMTLFSTFFCSFFFV